MQDIDRGKIQLLIHHPFFSHLLLQLIEKETDEIPTIGVDGTYLYYNPDYIRTLTREEVMSALCHEVLHLAWLHLVRQGTRDQGKWNVATDYAINAILKGDGFTVNRNWLYSKEFEDMSADEIYEKLPDDQSGCNGCKPGQKGHTQDDHSVWGKAKSPTGEDGEDGDGGTISAPPAFDPRVWKDRVAAAATTARMQGKLPASLSSMVDDLLHPVLDWKVILRDFVQASYKNNYRLFPPNKKFLHWPIYLPSTYGEEVKVAIAIDTSGSISDDELLAFISEVQGVTEQFEGYTLHIIQCDAGVPEGGYTVLTAYEGEIPRKISGRGGTSFEPPFQFVEDNNLDISALVYFTDGYGHFPQEPPYPTAWVMTTDVEPPFGTIIKYKR